MSEYENWLKKILESDFAKEWIQDDKNDSESVTHRSDFQKKSDLIYNFFEQELPEIIQVLPEIWEEIKSGIEDAVDDNILDTPEGLLNQMNYRKQIIVPYDLDDFLGDMIIVLTNTLKQQEVTNTLKQQENNL